MRMLDDMSYTNPDLIERGLMVAVPFQVRLDRYFTDEEKAANKAYAETHTDEEWVARCDEIREALAAEIIKVLDLLEQHFTIGQYKNNGYGNDYDLWFWCNSLYTTTSGRLTGNDYSYVTLSIFADKSAENGNRIFNEIRELLADYDAPNVQAIFQYSQNEIEPAIEAEAKRIFESCKGKFIKYDSYTGKLDWNESVGYTFKKKHGRTLYKVDAFDVCTRVEEVAA